MASPKRKRSAATSEPLNGNKRIREERPAPVIHTPDRLQSENVRTSSEPGVNTSTAYIASNNQVLHLVRDYTPDALDDLIDQLQHRKEQMKRTPCGLFGRLPAELRNEIYYLVIKDQILSYGSLYWGSLWGSSWGSASAIFRALREGELLESALSKSCRQIWSEMQYLINHESITMDMWNQASEQFENIDLDDFRAKFGRYSWSLASQFEFHNESRHCVRGWSSHIYVNTEAVGTIVFSKKLSIAPLAWQITTK